MESNLLIINMIRENMVSLIKKLDILLIAGPLALSNYVNNIHICHSCLNLPPIL